MAQESELNSYTDLIERQAETLGDHPYILYEDKRISFADFAAATRRAANGLKVRGARPGDGIAILMGNCPEYLSIFHGMPRGGFYSVPVNVSLKGEGLRYILTNSEVKYLVVDDVLFARFSELGSPVGAIEKVFVRRTTDAPLPAGALDLRLLFEASDNKPDHTPDPDAITYLMYTSGTTGFPKGVVNRNRSSNVQQFMMLASIMVKPVGSVGRPNPTIEWKLVDDDGNEVAQGEIGELVTKVADKKSRTVEYYKDPEASAQKVRGDWIHSGDFFYCDAEGNLYFVDRKTDSMRRRGENISSFEVENAIEKHPAVAECAAFGVRSELGEDEVMVWIKPRPGFKLDLKDLVSHCANSMAYFMVPRYVDVVDEIPRTGTLRIQKVEMKKRGVTARTWDREKEMPDLKLK
ncbi:MAG: AMP-binding protein [Candidatus Lindowbacteria bacterium]|nr:AMP-binding protein [Candidatus Lindowbacteria bacterium]